MLESLVCMRWAVQFTCTVALETGEEEAMEPEELQLEEQSRHIGKQVQVMIAFGFIDNAGPATGPS